MYSHIGSNKDYRSQKTPIKVDKNTMYFSLMLEYQITKGQSIKATTKIFIKPL
jgi:hypothetical protein